MERRRARAPRRGCRRAGAPRRTPSRCARAASASAGVEELRRAAHGHALEREPDREQLAQLLDVEPHHLRAVMRHVLGEAERLELAHRLADRRDAHAERAREILEPKRRPGRQLAHDDRLAQALERGLRHRPVPDGGASR